MSGKRVHRLYRRTDVVQLATARRAALGAGLVSRRLGVSNFQVERLRVAGVLVARFRTRCGFLFEPAHLEQLSRALRKVAIDRSAERDLVSLSDVPRHHQVQLAVVISAAKQERVALYAASDYCTQRPLFSQLWVTRRVATLGVDVPMVDHIDRRSAAKKLGLAQRMIGELIHGGCLRVAAPARGKTGVTASSVHAFHRQFVLSRELAEVKATSTRSVIEMLRKACIEPVVASDPSRGISAVWCRKAMVSTGILPRGSLI